MPEKTKRNGRVVTVPMTEALHDHLMKLAGDSNGQLCPTLAKVGSGGRSGLSGQFKAIMIAAGIENRVLAEAKGQGRTQSAKSFHSLRHSFNTALMNAGVDEKIRMDLSGHSTANVNRRYSHSEIETLRSAVAKM
jgi:integrase